MGWIYGNNDGGVLPSRELSADTNGIAPGPHNVRKPKPPGGTVAFIEYALAVAGTLPPLRSLARDARSLG
jgi:hypothetical protein